MSYSLIIIPLVAFFLVLLVGLIVAARQRPSRHDLTLEHIEKLEKELGMGAGESGNLKDADRTELAPKQIDAERAEGARAAPHRVPSDGDPAQ